MDRTEAADLLGFVQGYDKREITKAEVSAWALALGAVGEDEAREAVILHYQAATWRIKPEDILRILRERTARLAPPKLPAPARHDKRVAVEGRRLMNTMAEAAHAENLARRARVLSHPDLAVRLTGDPLNYERPGMWNGFVPPREDQDCRADALHTAGIHGPGYPNQRGQRTVGRRANDSPRRAALVEICAEALRREKEPAGEEEEW